MLPRNAIVFPDTEPANDLAMALPAASAAVPRATERLPFTVRRVDNQADLWKAVRMRHSAYSRHVPELARQLTEPEACDYGDDSVVFIAESKLDGSVLGTARMESNLHAPLHVEEAIDLPDWLRGRPLAEMSRLGVDNSRIGRVVKTALLKAGVQYCQQNGIAWALACGRSPVDRQYEQLTFIDVFPQMGFIPLPYADNMLHRVMAFDIATIEQRWSAARHPLLNFFCHTHHPDIDAGGKSGVRMPLPGAGVGMAAPNVSEMYQMVA